MKPIKQLSWFNIMSSISKLPKNNINWIISMLHRNNKQKVIVLIMFFWEGKASGIRNPIGIKGMILPRIFIKGIPEFISLIYVLIVLKGTRFIANSPWFLHIILLCTVLKTLYISPLNLNTIKISTNSIYKKNIFFQATLNTVEDLRNFKIE